MIKILKFFVFFFLCVQISAQKCTVYGYIKDSTTGEFLIGASVMIIKQNIGTVTNNYGFYSLSLPKGNYSVKFSFIGYEPVITSLIIENDIELNVELRTQVSQLNEIVIKDVKNNKILNLETGSQTLDIKKIKQLPSSFGEPDIAKSIQLTPGIQTTNEGTTNLSVRGGTYDQNLYLLDDAPVYNPSHALGFFSAFNPDAIKSVKVYKTNFPAQYGGRLSSVIDIYMKEGNSKNFSVNGGIGIIASRLTLEGPILKDKVSYIISGRYSYAGFTVNTLGDLGQQIGIKSLKNFEDNNEISFYDLNLKINYQINRNNRLFLSTYTGKDHFYYYAINNNNNMDWGNLTSTLRWNHLFSSNLFSNTMIIYSKYNYSYILKDDVRFFKWSSSLSEVDLKSDFDFYVNSNNHIQFGYSAESHNYYPGKIEPRDSASITKAFSLEDEYAIIGSLYLNNEQKISERISASYGLRYSAFFLLGPNSVYSYNENMEITDTINYNSGELIKFYHNLEPRLSIRYLINKSNSLKVSYNRTSQYQHLISHSSVGLPSDIWLPSNTYIKPLIADQISIGYYTLLLQKLEFSTEIYYRKLKNVVDYRDNADLFLNPQVETQTLTGSGESYGIEFYLDKKYGRLNGWASYTLSKTNRQINGINDNNPYPATFDKRHNFSIVLCYNLTTSWSLSTVFKYTSGGYITVPEGTFNFYGASFNYYSKRNGYALPPYHRLDISINYSSKRNETRKCKIEWNAGIYNVYGRKNIFTLFIKQDSVDLDSSSAYIMYLYGITPYLSFNFRF